MSDVMKSHIYQTLPSISNSKAFSTFEFNFQIDIVFNWHGHLDLNPNVWSIYHRVITNLYYIIIELLSVNLFYTEIGHCFESFNSHIC